ncbi:CHAT domain-containing protein [Streptomyces sp. NRRL B-24484]|uniref:CHAT domain-containing protein n=1 Tax=Streptomyces sp. NRRL B-24484 TaxID=1463833 RepID=UPI000693930E|nr:CHAT domain-containing protein [Streptomyces sp. NRRL B-24484]
MVREAQLAALQARVDRTLESGDPSWVLGPGVLRDARRLAEAHDDVEVRYALGWFRWSRYLYGGRRSFSRDELTAELRDAVEAFTVCFMLVGADDLPEPLLPVIAERAALQAVAAFRRAQGSPDRISCAVAATMVRRVLAATPTDSPKRAERLALVAEVVRDWGVRGLRILDPDLLLACVRGALEAAPDDHPDRVAWLTDIAGLLQARGQRTESADDLDEAAEAAWEAVVEAGPDHPDIAEPLWMLGITLASRHNVTAEDTDLDKAITYLRMALSATPADHPRHAMRLSHLGTALRARYQAKGERADLEESIEVGQRAVSVGSAEEFVHADALATLGNALWARRLLTGSADDRDEAIVLGRQAAATVSDQERPVVLANLGGRLAQRFDRTGALADADAAVEHLQEVTDATRARGDSVFLEAAANLSSVLMRRFEVTGALADLDEAIAKAREVVAAAATEPLYLWGARGNLAVMLMRRSERTGTSADLDEAVTLARAAAAAATEPHRSRLLANLGSVLQARAELGESAADLDEAITAARAAAATTTDPVDLASAQSGLANALMRRSELTGTSADLDEAITIGRQVADTVPADFLERATCLSNLAGALTVRFRRSASQTDLTEAISHYLAAAKAAATASAAVNASYRAARLLAETGDHGRAAQAAENAVLRLPEVAPRRLERGDQQHAVGQFSGLAGRAAALALAAPGGTDAERAARALRLLEAGRAVLIGQTLETRGDLTDLYALRADLATRYVELRARLDAGTRTTAAIRPLGGTADEELAHERLARGRRVAAEEFAALLEEIRDLKGFASFALPPTDEELIAEAAHGPVVVFNISEYRSDALLITTDGIRNLELPGLTPGMVTDQVNRFRNALHTARAATEATDAELAAAQRAVVSVLTWLWDVATGPVLAALNMHGRQDVSDDWPRVWWVPGGLLGLLPLHAAGYHNDRPERPRQRRTVMDRVVSSYTPTVRALRHSRERAARATGGTPARSLVVAMPTTPGLPGNGRLHYVGKEVAMLLGRLPDPVLLEEPDPENGRAVSAGALPTRDHVLAQLPHCSIAHFACHGFSDPADPSRSLMLLHDFAQAPLTVGSLASVALDEARLAYLSACRTAAIDNSELLDEAIHLTSAFQLAGFPHVIGTLWEIDDQVAVTVASLFYAGLGAGRASPDPDRAARALHQAVRRVRDGYGLPPHLNLNLNGAPRLWAAYLHVGA